MRPFEVKNCAFSGSVIATGENAGGIVGGGYAGTQWGIASAPNTPMVTIQGCTVTGSVQGNQNVGGILGGEPGMVQCWANGIGHVENNLMRGTVSGNENVGAIIGYMHSLNRYSLISGNQYMENCGSDKPIGGAWLVDTNMENPTPVDGVEYICTEGGTSGCPSVKFCSWKKDHHREDDPLGADADTLATVIAAPKLSGLSLPADSLDGAMTPSFDAGTTVYSAVLLEHQDTLALTVSYPQGATATATYDGKTVTLSNGTATNLSDFPTGEVPVTIELVGANGAKRTYTLRVTNPAEAPSLTELSLPAASLKGTMTPDFAPSILTYAADLKEHQDALNLTVSYPIEADATVKYGNQDPMPLNNGAATPLTNLPTGDVILSIELTGDSGAKKTYTLTVSNPAPTAVLTVTKLEITGYRTEYEVGAPKLDLTGATITATWSDGSTATVDPQNVQFEGFDSTSAGTKTIRLTYEGASTTMTVTVKAAASSSTVYFALLGDSSHGETSSPHTLKEGGLTTWISRKAYSIASGDTVLDVIRKACQENNISIIGKGTEYGYYIEGLTRNGTTLSEFTNGRNSGWMYTLNGHHPDKSVDSQKVTAGDEIVFHYTDDYTWEEGSESWLTVQSIAVSGPSKKTYNQGEDLNLVGLVITATMDNGQTKNVPLNAVTISGYNKNTVGSQTVTVTYESKTATFTVEVKASAAAPTLTGIALSGEYKTTYTQGEELDKSKMVINAIMSDGTRKSVPVADAVFTGYDKNKTGRQTVTVTYEGKTATFTVVVNPAVGEGKKIESLTVTGTYKTIYKKGEALDLTGAQITAKWSDNSNNITTTYPDIKLLKDSGYDPNKIGKQTVTLEYQGKTCTIEVTVAEDSSNSSGGSGSGSNTNDGTSGTKSSGSNSAATQKRTPKEVETLITAIGEVTLEKQDAINEARQAYELLSASEKKNVKNYQTLLDAEAALYTLRASSLSVEEIYRTTGKFLHETVPQPAVGFVGGEWAVLGLARAGYPVEDGYFDSWYQNLVNLLKENNGVLHDKRYTDYSRVVLALTAVGYDVTDVAGYNLLVPLADFDKVVWQGINGAIFGLIALDTHNYEIPAAPAGVKQTTREDLIEHILNLEVSGGGWSLAGGADVDITAMAIQSLAPYCKDNKKVAEAVERGLNVLSAMQNDRGSFSNGYELNSESCAQVIVALTALGIDPTTDARFIKNGRSVMDAMVEFYVSGGGFRHVMDGEVNGMATEQGYYALAAYYRFLEGKTRLYDMTDVVLPESEVLPTEPEPIQEPEPEPESGAPIQLIVAAVLAGTGCLAVVVLLVLKRKRTLYTD